MTLVSEKYISYESLVDGTLILWDVLKISEYYNYVKEVREVIQRRIEMQNTITKAKSKR